MFSLLGEGDVGGGIGREESLLHAPAEESAEALRLSAQSSGSHPLIGEGSDPGTNITHGDTVRVELLTDRGDPLDEAAHISAVGLDGVGAAALLSLEIREEIRLNIHSRST